MQKIFLVLLAVTCFAVTVEADVFRQTEDYVISLELNADVWEDILRNIRNYLPFSYSGKLLSRTHLKTFEEIVNTGLFEEVDGENIGKVAAISITALFNGAPAETIADIALIAFSKPLTESQMTTGAKALKNMSDAGISEDIQQQVVSYGFYNDWSNRNIRGISNGMIEGKRQSIPLEKLALALILRIDQGTVGVSFENTVDEEIGFIRNLRSSDPERMRRESIYRSMQSAAEKGLPEGIANDFYYNAVDEGWSAEDAQKLFDALVDGFRQGMTPEKLALAFILRMEADAGKVPIEKIITDEKKYVASLQNSFAQDALPLHSVYAISTTNTRKLDLKELTGISGFQVFIRNTFRKRFLDGLGGREGNFEQAVAVAKHAKVSHVTRPRRPFLLNELIQLLEEDFK